MTAAHPPIARRALAVVMVSLVGVSACGGDDIVLPPERIEEMAPVVQGRLASADIELELVGATCVTERLDVEQADELAATDLDVGLPEPLAETLADGVQGCADPTELARSALAPFLSGATEESASCAADRLDEDLIAEVLVTNLRQVPLPAAQAELEIAVALGLCFEPEELLNRG